MNERLSSNMPPVPELAWHFDGHAFTLKLNRGVLLLPGVSGSRQMPSGSDKSALLRARMAASSQLWLCVISRLSMIFCVGCPASSSSQSRRGYSYGEFKMGWSKKGLDIITFLPRQPVCLVVDQESGVPG